MKLLIVCLALMGCSPTYAIATRGNKCPIPTTVVLLDTLTGVALGAISSIKFSAGKETEAYVYGGVSGMFIGGSFASEFACALSKN